MLPLNEDDFGGRRGADGFAIRRPEGGGWFLDRLWCHRVRPTLMNCSRKTRRRHHDARHASEQQRKTFAHAAQVQSTKRACALHRRRFGSVQRSALERAKAPITPSPNCASHCIRRAQTRNAGRTCPIWRSGSRSFEDVRLASTATHLQRMGPICSPAQKIKNRRAH